MEFVCSNAAMFVDYWWADIKAAAKALLKRETLTGDEILDVIHTARRQSGRRGRIGLKNPTLTMSTAMAMARWLGDPEKFYLSASVPPPRNRRVQRGVLTT